MKKILILLIVLTLLFVGCSKDSDISTPSENNQPPKENTENSDVIMSPDFELESLDGTVVKLSDLKGKNIIINFWATWCGFCVQEMPDLQKLQENYKDEDFILLAINVGESKEEAEKFMRDNNLDFTVLLDKDRKVSSTYGVRSFPSTIAINKDGEVVDARIGMLNYEQMEVLYDSFNK